MLQGDTAPSANIRNSVRYRALSPKFVASGSFYTSESWTRLKELYLTYYPEWNSCCSELTGMFHVFPWCQPVWPQMVALVTHEGIEPCVVRLRTECPTIGRMRRVVRATGIEPALSVLSRRCSATERRVRGVLPRDRTEHLQVNNLTLATSSA